MKKLALLLAATTLTVFSDPSAKLTYPPAPVVNQIDDYHGTKISDPHRTLENADAPETTKWVEQENALTFSYLAALPGREVIKARLTKLWDYEKFSSVYKAGSHYFYSHNTGLQNQSVIYVMDGLNGSPRVLVDPNTYRADGTAALSNVSVSWNGKLFGYAVAQAGSDWTEWHIRNVDTGQDLPDTIRWTKESPLAWIADDTGFYYARYAEPPADKLLTVQAKDEKLYYHKLGDAQSADKLIYERPDHSDWFFGPQVSEDGRYLFLTVEASDSARNLLFFKDLHKPESPVVELISELKYLYDPIEVSGSTLFVRTTDQAPRGRVIAIDLDRSARDRWREVIPQQAETLESVRMASDKLVLAYMKDAYSAARMTDLQGKSVSELALPGIGTVAFSPNRKNDHELFYLYTSYVTPPTFYRLDLAANKSTVFRRTSVNIDTSAFETKQVFCTSKDGTRVPIFLSYRKGLKLDGSNPTLLYAYGGFNIPLTPAFNVATVEWMDLGGIYAVANLRGGSEYGDEWHLAGTKVHKQNVFDDFIASAEWLIANKYTSTPKLAIFGASNGGLLVGAVLNQRPDLFGAAMPAVGVMDMLRFHKFGFGATWIGDYGSPDNPLDFQAIRAYSPLHNIRKGTAYPPTLITTSDHDDRVMPGHSLKYAATLQEAQEGPAPILIRIETRAGHGAGKPTSKQIDEWADRFVFLAHSLGIKTPSE